MSLFHLRTQAHHLPELADLADLAPVGTFTSGPHADESDYAAEYATALLCDAMDAARLSAPPVEPDPDGARSMAEYALHQQAPTDAELAADEDVSAFLDASRAQFIDWLSTMGSDPHAARPGVALVRPSTRPSSPAVSA
jgi:hypothetical protein